MTEIAAFTYKGLLIGVYLEPSNRNPKKKTVHYRPANGKSYPPTINPVNLCKAIRRWRIDNAKFLKYHGAT